MELSRVDHLVYAAPDLDSGVAAVEEVLGVRAAQGGNHPDWGTCNALLALGPATYLEVIGPDNSLPEPGRPRPFGIDQLEEPRLAAWALKEADLEHRSRLAASQGLHLGEVQAGSRRTPGGDTLSWRLTDLHVCPQGGLVPFLIDWGKTPSPALSAPAGCRLVALEGRHPTPRSVAGQLRRIGVPLPVSAASEPALVATIESPMGLRVLS